MGCKACCQKIPTRFLIAAMIFFTNYICYVARSNISISLPAMVKSHKKETLVADCIQNGINYKQNTTQAELDIDTGVKYDWNEHVQGLILGAYFYGYLFGCLPAGTMAEWIGPVWTIQTSNIITIILNSACVWLVAIHWGALFAARFVIGICGALVYPSIQCLVSRWAPPEERNIFIACLMGGALGTCMTWIIVGAVTKYYQWSWGFHVMTLQMLIFCIVFGIVTFDSPELHKWITEKELNYIKVSQEGKVSTKKAVPPYKAIFKSFPFWSLSILHFGNMWGLYVQLTTVPKFMKEYVGFDIKDSGALSSLPHLLRLFSGFSFGYLGDFLRRKKIKRSIIMKSFIICSHLIPGILMATLALADCNSIFVVVLLTLSMCFNGAAVVTNLTNPMDLSPNFAGTITGIISFIGGVTGFMVPSTMAELLTAFESKKIGWGAMFAIGGFMYCICGIFFMIFGSTDIQPWNEKVETQQETST
ncbi:hypothetical protein ABEB36_004177 [Hypothenemus hampei]|uniref:Major facilitator superfamily (MFS) profile domain-containing protein n=1 Tax=Hypothenemus hampei TaxID=57062 RepID=A0ABD1F3V3_HYPHA